MLAYTLAMKVWTKAGVRDVPRSERWEKRCACGLFIPFEYETCDDCLLKTAGASLVAVHIEGYGPLYKEEGVVLALRAALGAQAGCCGCICHVCASGHGTGAQPHTQACQDRVMGQLDVKRWSGAVYIRPTGRGWVGAEGDMPDIEDVMGLEESATYDMEITAKKKIP